eukprot:9347088-Pyramimonas_sp.AAC.1
MADKAGKPFNWHVGNVGNLLRHVRRESSEHAAIIERAVEGGIPLTLVLYLDEITPGDALAPRHDRKIWMLLFSFLEFGSDMLRRQELWLPCGALRSKVASGVNGGISCVVRPLLRN